MSLRYYQGIVADNADPDQRGGLMLTIAGITGPDETYPEWIGPRIPGGAGPAACALFWVPPVDAQVIVEADHDGQLRWHGAELGQVNTLPDILATSYGRRAGFTSPEGAQGLVLDEDDGFLFDGSAAVIIGADGGVTLTNDPNAPTQQLLLAETYLTEFNTWLTGLTAFLAACVADAAMSPGVAAGAGSFTPTHSAFAALVGAQTTLLSQVSRTA